MAQFTSIVNGLAVYGIDHDEYPSTEQGLKEILWISGSPRTSKSLLGTYPTDPAIFTDPWGKPFVYRKLPGDEYALLSKGPDGVEGTEDDITGF